MIIFHLFLFHVRIMKVELTKTVFSHVQKASYSQISMSTGLFLQALKSAQILWGINLCLEKVQVIFQVRVKPDIFLRFKPENLLLNTTRYNLSSNLKFFSGLIQQVQTWKNIQVSPDNPTFQAQINYSHKIIFGQNVGYSCQCLQVQEKLYLKW